MESMKTARGSLFAFARLEARQVMFLALAAALIAFCRSIADGFVFDDEPLIVPPNPVLRTILPPPAAASSRSVGRPPPSAPSLRPATSTRFYRPVVCLRLASSDWKLGGGAPVESFNLRETWRCTPRRASVARLAVRWTKSIFHGALFAAALVLAVHPSRTENVIWVRPQPTCYDRTVL